MSDTSEEDGAPPCLFASSGLFASAGRLGDDDNQCEQASATHQQQTWLTNESFRKDVSTVNKLDEHRASAEHDLTSREEAKKRKHKKEKKKKSKKIRTKSPDQRDARSSREPTVTVSSDNDVYRIDRKYVKDSLMYDSLYAGDVPRYRLDGASRKGTRSAGQRYFKVKLGQCQAVDHKSTTKSRYEFKFNKDYIELVDAVEANQLAPTPTTRQDDADKDAIVYDNPHLYSRTKEYNAHLNRNPTDVDKWIEFIQFQDELQFELNNDDLRDGPSASKKSKTANDVFLTEKKLLVVERALKSNPTDIRLLITRLELLNSKIESDELNKEWNNLIFTYPTNFEIIKNYLKFIITHISYFNSDHLNRFFARYMEKIVQYQEGSLKSVRNQATISPVDLERSMLDVLLLYTTVLRQCGYVEKSISVWQALIEFNFNKPDLLNAQTSLDDWKEYFEVFWSSGEARFGEKHACGWKSVLEQHRDANEKSNKEELSEDEKAKLLNRKENEVILESNNDLNKIWFEIELLREKYNWLSGKPHEDCDDSDHIVLFEDISSCLFRFKELQTYRNCLLYFLCSLNAIKVTHRQSHVSYSPLSTDEMIIDLPTFYLDNEEQLLNSPNTKLFTPKYFTYDQRLNFTITVFQQSMALVENNQDAYGQLVGHYLNFIIANVRNLNQEKCRKLFKQILKKQSNRGEIRFWMKFAELEAQLNERTSAKNIFDKILDMLITQQQPMSPLNGSMINENLRLIHDFIEFTLRANHIKHISLSMINCMKTDDNKKESQIGEEILIFIYSLMNSKTAAFKRVDELSAPVQLRITKKIDKLLEAAFEQLAANTDEQTKDQQVINLIYLIVLKIYAHYFRQLLPLDASSAQRNKETPLKVLEQTSALINEQMTRVRSIDSSSSDHIIELLYEKHLDLHLLYLKYNFSQLTSFNRLLREALEQFPTNRYFLMLLVNTQPFRLVNGQVERFTIELCRRTHETTLEQWLFVIYCEMQRLANIQTQSIQDFVSCYSTGASEPSGDIQGYRAIDHTGTYSIGLATRIRNLFEKALQTHNCLFLWRLFMHFEVNQNNLEKAKIIFYRAVQRCPWSKLLYMDGVKIFTIMNTTTTKRSDDRKATPLIQNAENLNDVLDLMIEKQLRVRTAVEEAQFLFDNQQLLTVPKLERAV